MTEVWIGMVYTYVKLTELHGEIAFCSRAREA